MSEEDAKDEWVLNRLKIDERAGELFDNNSDMTADEALEQAVEELHQEKGDFE